MYLEHFGLKEAPFRITPHIDFFFDGADRGATLEALLYAIQHDEGIVKVSGEVGSGKTMLCRVLMERLPAHVATIYLATPSLARDEILLAIADELELKFSQDRMTVALRELQDHLIRLYGAGRRVVILIDEAHAMPEETLEQVRLLSNLESSRHKLLQMVLFAQPELDELLGKPALRQLKDRITHTFRMRPLAEPEVASYLSFRMRAAGYRGPDIFTPKAVVRIARSSSGLTRRINILADKSLLAAFAANAHSITARHARAAVADSEFAPLRGTRGPVAIVGAALAAGVLIGVAVHWAFSSRERPAPVLPAAAVVAQPEKPPVPAAAPAPELAEVLPPAIEPQVKEPAPPKEPAHPSDRLSLQQIGTLQIPPAPKEPALPPERLSPAQLRRITGFPTGGQRLLAERIAATRQALEREPDERWGIELFWTENTEPARLERFLLRARELVPLEQLYLVPMSGTSTGRTRVRAVVGAYASRMEAAEAERRLPSKYQKAFRTSLRSFAELRRSL